MRTNISGIKLTIEFSGIWIGSDSFRGHGSEIDALLSELISETFTQTSTNQNPNEIHNNEEAWDFNFFCSCFFHKCFWVKGLCAFRFAHWLLWEHDLGQMLVHYKTQERCSSCCWWCCREVWRFRFDYVSFERLLSTCLIRARKPWSLVPWGGKWFCKKVFLFLFLALCFSCVFLLFMLLNCIWNLLTLCSCQKLRIHDYYHTLWFMLNHFNTSGLNLDWIDLLDK